MSGEANIEETTDFPAVSTQKTRPKFHRLMDKVFIGMIVAFVVSQYIIWNHWESPFGDSLKNMITYAARILLQITLIGWIFLFSPFSRKTMLIIGIPIAAFIIGRWAMIKEVQWSGDMEPHIIWRWEKSQDEILADYRDNLSTGKLADTTTVPEITPLDMPSYRGENRDGILNGPELLQDWEATPPKELWKIPCGGGYAGISVVGPLLVTIEQREEFEAIVCYESATGAEIWEHRYPASFQEAMGGAGPRSTPAIHGDAVYTLGAMGDLFCLDLMTGEVRWHFNVLQQFILPNNHWAVSSSPLVLDDNLIVNVGGEKGNGLVAYKLDSGELQWHSEGLTTPVLKGTYKTGVAGIEGTEKFSAPGYASPMLATIDGVEQILNLDGKALRGHDRNTGEQLWSFPFNNDADVNVAQPIVLDENRIFITASYGVGAAVVKISLSEAGKWTAEKLWQNTSMRCKFTSPVFHDGYLYGLDEAIMVCLDPETGKRKWKGGRTPLRGRYGHGQILLTNGQILVVTEKGQIALIDPSPEKLIEVGHIEILEGEKTWNHHALANGKVYLRNAYEMACYDLRAEPAMPNPETELGSEATAE